MGEDRHPEIDEVPERRPGQVRGAGRARQDGWIGEPGQYDRAEHGADLAGRAPAAGDQPGVRAANVLANAPARARPEAVRRPGRADQQRRGGRVGRRRPPAISAVPATVSDAAPTSHRPTGSPYRPRPGTRSAGRRGQEQVGLGEGDLKRPFVVRDGDLGLLTTPGPRIELDEDDLVGKVGHDRRNPETDDADDGPPMDGAKAAGKSASGVGGRYNLVRSNWRTKRTADGRRTAQGDSRFAIRPEFLGVRSAATNRPAADGSRRRPGPGHLGRRAGRAIRPTP